MQRFFGLLDRDQEFRSILRGMEGFQHQQAVYGLSGSQKGFVLAALMQKTNRPFLVVTHSEEAASELTENICALLPERKVAMFPVLEWLPYQVLGRSREIEGKRLAVLEQLLQGENLIIVTTVQAVERLLVPKQKWASLCRRFQVGEVYELGAILDDLLTMGYERVDILEGPGQFAVRGGILDIFPLTKEPLRMEFFDDELDTIRIVNPSTLRSTQQIHNVNLVPARELPISWEEVNKNWASIKSFAQKVVNRLTKTASEAADRLKQHLDSLDEKVGQGVFDQALEQFAGFFYPKMETLFDYLLSETVVVLDEAMRLKEYMDFTGRERAEEHLNLLQAGQVFA
ncbi:MAG TPA: transcription-repair coupling factor, partial [Verrucomicrobiae bacterium]|nr:transcription-repair coupling factor [Verrucomicrobiae bacterium]